MTKTVHHPAVGEVEVRTMAGGYFRAKCDNPCPYFESAFKRSAKSALYSLADEMLEEVKERAKELRCIADRWEEA